MKEKLKHIQINNKQDLDDFDQQIDQILKKTMDKDEHMINIIKKEIENCENDTTEDIKLMKKLKKTRRRRTVI